jgi:NAD(P)H dehydrogenase (quinone)
MTRLAVIYYSATGHGTKMAQQVAKAAEEAGAEVMLSGNFSSSCHL